jgi:transposase
METRPALSHEVWARTPPEAQAYMRALEARVATLEGMLQALQEQRHQTSRNSSRPPSSAPPHRERPRRPRSTRRRGGHPGHPGHTRPLVPVDDVDEVVVIKPTQCPHCQAPFTGDDPTPWRHQGIEIPPCKPVVTEEQWHQLACPACGATTRAPGPAGVPSGTYGPRVQAPVALCTGAYRLSKRTPQQVMEEVCGVPLSVGTLSPLERATTEAVTAPVEAARTYVHAQEVVHLDETRWRQGDKRAGLWVAVTSWVTVCVVRLSRGGQVARELVGETFSGLLVPDRYSASNWYPVRWRQVCWAHL